MRGRNASLAGLLFFCHLGSVAAQTTELVDRSELQVCADPNHLPFSDEKKDGFDNKIAELIGAELGLKVDYVWFPQVIGFVRNTLRAHLCDLVMGTVAGDEVMQTTNPYYFTTYAMLYRSDKGLELKGLQDRRLTGLRLGIVAGTPPADLLAPRFDATYQALRTHHRTCPSDPRDGAGRGDSTIDRLPVGTDRGLLPQARRAPITLVPQRAAGCCPDGIPHRNGVRANEAEWAAPRQRCSPSAKGT
jgi:hypothetical protein